MTSWNTPPNNLKTTFKIVNQSLIKANCSKLPSHTNKTTCQILLNVFTQIKLRILGTILKSNL